MDAGAFSHEQARMTPESLVRQHGAAVLAVCLAHTRSRHDAEDAMQESLLKAIQNLDRLRDRALIRPWVLQIARRVCIDRHRQRVAEPLPEDLPAPQRSADPRLERLHGALVRLPDDYREAICLFYLDGRSTASVAEALEISEAAVRQRLCRGRLMLHESMSEDEA